MSSLIFNNYFSTPLRGETSFNSSFLYQTYISGRVLEKDLRLKGEACVYLLEKTSMLVVDVSLTYNNGFFRFLNMNPSLEYTVVSRPVLDIGYNAVVLDRVKPIFYKAFDETYPDLSIKPKREVIEYPPVIENVKNPSDFLKTSLIFNEVGLQDTSTLSTWTSSNVSFVENVNGTYAILTGTSSLTSLNSSYFNFKETDFTLKFYINILEKPTNNGAILITATNGFSSDVNTLAITSEGFLRLFSNKAILLTSLNTLDIDTWYEIVLTREEGRISLFINGVKEAHLGSVPLSFFKNGTVIGLNPTSDKTFTNFKGFLHSFSFYSKSIYQRDFGVSPFLSNLQLFNENLKTAILFESGVRDIASNIPLTYEGLTLSSTVFEEGVGSAYCENASLVIESDIILTEEPDDFTLEFSLRPSTFGNKIPLVQIGTDSFYLNNESQIVFNNLPLTYSNLLLDTFNKIIISRRDGVIGVLVNYVLVHKELSTNSFNKIDFFFKEGTDSFKGYIDTIKYFTKYVNYRFNTFIYSPNKYDNYLTSSLNFSEGFKDNGKFPVAVTTVKSPTITTEKCVSVPNCLLSSGGSSVTLIDTPLNFYREWTISSWFYLPITLESQQTVLLSFDHRYRSSSTSYNFKIIVNKSFNIGVTLGNFYSFNNKNTTTYIEGYKVPFDRWFKLTVEYLPSSLGFMFYINNNLIGSLENVVNTNNTDLRMPLSVGSSLTSSDFNKNLTWSDDIRLYPSVRLSKDYAEWHPLYNSKQIFPVSFSVNEDFISLDRTTYRETLSNNTFTAVDSKPSLHQEENSQSLLLGDSFLTGSITFPYSPTKISSYLVFKPTEVVGTVPSKQNVLSIVSTVSARSLLLSISIGDGLDAANNNKVCIEFSPTLSSTTVYKTVSKYEVIPNQWLFVKFKIDSLLKKSFLYINGNLNSTLDINTLSNRTSYFATIGGDIETPLEKFIGFLSDFYMSLDEDITQNEQEALDKYFSIKYGIDLPLEHPYKNKEIVFEDII